VIRRRWDKHALVLDLVLGGMSQADIAGILKREAPNFV
jgi:hypothetical protein